MKQNLDLAVFAANIFSSQILGMEGPDHGLQVQFLASNFGLEFAAFLLYHPSAETSGNDLSNGVISSVNRF